MKETKDFIPIGLIMLLGIFIVFNILISIN